MPELYALNLVIIFYLQRVYTNTIFYTLIIWGLSWHLIGVNQVLPTDCLFLPIQTSGLTRFSLVLVEIINSLHLM